MSNEKAIVLLSSKKSVKTSLFLFKSTAAPTFAKKIAGAGNNFHPCACICLDET